MVGRRVAKQSLAGKKREENAPFPEEKAQKEELERSREREGGSRRISRRFKALQSTFLCMDLDEHLDKKGGFILHYPRSPRVVVWWKSNRTSQQRKAAWEIVYKKWKCKENTRREYNKAD